MLEEQRLMPTPLLSTQEIEFLRLVSSSLETDLTLLNWLSRYEWATNRVNIAAFFSDLFRLRASLYGKEHFRELCDEYMTQALSQTQRLISDIQSHVLDFASIDAMASIAEKNYTVEKDTQRFFLNA